MISRRKLIQLTVAAVGVTVVGGYLSIDDTEVMPELHSLDLQFLSAEQAAILALLMVVVLDHEQLGDIKILKKWLVKIDEALAYLPDNQQRDLLMLLDTLTHKLGRLVLTADISQWQRGDTELINKILNNWRNSSLDLLNTAYVGIKQLIMAVWYGEPENWSDIAYSGPPNLGGMAG